MRTRSSTIGHSTVRGTWRFALLLGTIVLLLSRCGQADVVRIEIGNRKSSADVHLFDRTGPYERLTGRLFLEGAPNAECNSQIVDSKLASRNECGYVVIRTDLLPLKPCDASQENRHLFYDGNKLALALVAEQVLLEEGLAVILNLAQM